MKKVVIFRSNPINPDSRVEKEANSLQRLGYDVTLFGWDRDNRYIIKSDKKILKDGVVNRICIGAKAKYGAGFKSLLPYLRFQTSIFFWIIKNGRRYDIFHFCDFDTAFTGAKACRIIRKPFIFDIFDYLSTDAKTSFQRIIKYCEDEIISNADATIICTENRRQQISCSTPHNLVIIHNSPEAIENVKSGSNRGRVKIAYVGILQDYRMLEELLQVVKENSNLELHIGGFGKYENLIKEYSNANNNIIFYGKIPYNQTIAIEQNCDILTAIYDPSIGNHKYAAPNKFYEGLMLGKPLVMVNGTGMSEYINQYEIGVLIDYTKESLNAGIQELCDRRDEWTDMSVRMKKLYEEEFSWNEMEKRLGQLYKKI